MSEWFIVDDDQGLAGPFSLNELSTMLRDGDLSPTGRVQPGRSAAPLPVDQVPELRSAASIAPRRRHRSSGTGTSSAGSTWLLLLAVCAGLAVLSCLVLLPALLFPTLQQAREAARRVQSQDQLRNLLIALHNYEGAHKTFPPGGVIAVDGTEHHGWPTALLPFVESTPLFSALRVHESHWRDPALTPLIRQEVAAFLNPAVGSPWTATGEGAIHYSANREVFFENSSTRVASVTDGTSLTIFLGEISADYPPWASPRNFRDLSLGFGRAKGQFGSPTLPGCQVAFGDATVRLLSDAVDPATLRKLATHQGGEVVTLP